MKKLVTILLILLVILTLGVSLLSRGKINIYTDVEHINYDSVLTEDTSTPTIYYYYKDNCGFCNSIKDQVTEMYEAMEEKGGVQLKMVDMNSTSNADAWYQGDTPADQNPDFISDPEEMKTYKDILVQGTPTMILVENGKVLQYKVGQDVFDILETVNDQYDLGVDLDRSAYGE